MMRTIKANESRLWHATSKTKKIKCLNLLCSLVYLAIWLTESLVLLVKTNLVPQFGDWLTAAQFSNPKRRRLMKCPFKRTVLVRLCSLGCSLMSHK